MKKTLAFIILMLTASVAFSQSKKKKQVPPPADTVTVDLKPAEREVFKNYVAQYQNAQERIAAIQRELQFIEQSYNSAAKVCVEARGGDSNKWFEVRGDKVLYLKPE